MRYAIVYFGHPAGKIVRGSATLEGAKATANKAKGTGSCSCARVYECDTLALGTEPTKTKKPLDFARNERIIGTVNRELAPRLGNQGLENEMTAQEKMAKILEVLQSGKTVYIQTALRVTKVSAKDVEKFAAINRPLFKADTKSLYISAGNRYDCIDFCKITAV